MINVLIADDNIHFAKKLMDYINKLDYIKVTNLATDGQEVLDIINSNESIDVIVLDLKMPNVDGLEILNIVYETKREKYNHSCIVISGENEYIQRLVKNEIIYGFINKNKSMSDILDLINQLIDFKNEEKNKNDLLNRINDELAYLGYDRCYKGTIYLTESIFYIANQSKLSCNNLKKEVFAVIAKRYNDNIHNIKSNISRATEIMYSNCESSKLIKYFNLAEDTKPNMKNVINTVLYNIQNK